MFIKDRIKISDNFYLDEFICPEIYKKIGIKSASLISEKLIFGVERLRKDIKKPIFINNYAIGGNFKYSGLRPMDCEEGAEWSDHKFGHAIDIKVYGINSFLIQNFIANNWNIYSIFFTTIESDTDGWTHLSDRFIPFWDKNKIFWINK